MQTFSGNFFPVWGGGVSGRRLCRKTVPWRNFSWRKILFMKEALGFPALFKNNQKLNGKNKFFHLKLRSYIKFKTNINYYVYEGLKVHSFIHFSHLRIAQPVTFIFIKKNLRPLWDVLLLCLTKLVPQMLVILVT